MARRLLLWGVLLALAVLARHGCAALARTPDPPPARGGTSRAPFPRHRCRFATTLVVVSAFSQFKLIEREEKPNVRN